MGNWIVPERRKAIHIRDRLNGRVLCPYCGATTTLKIALAEWTLDHIVPRVQGGSNATENLISCCQTCNSRKGKLTLKRFLLMNENEYNIGRSADFVLRLIAKRTSKPLGQRFKRMRI